MDEDRGKDRDDGQYVTAGPVVAFFKKVRQGGNLGANVEGDEEEREDDQGEGRHPFEVAEGEAVVIALLGEGHQVDGRDVRGEKGQSNDRPLQGTAGEKVVARRVVAALATANRDPQAEPDNEGQVANDDDKIELAGHDEVKGWFRSAASGETIAGGY